MAAGLVGLEAGGLWLGSHAPTAVQTITHLGNAAEGPTVAKTVGTGIGIAATVPLWKRTSLFGPTFSRHGAQRKLLSLIDRARDTGDPQGQWLDNEVAADFLVNAVNGARGNFVTRIPEGLGRIVLPTGAVRAAEWAVVTFNRRGGIRTAYPLR